MRVLFCSGPLYGHVNTMLPLALEAQRCGHEVVFATGADLVAHVERYGLEAWRVGVTHAEAGGSQPESWLRYFESAAEKRAADLVPHAVAWEPDLLIHEETDLAGPVAAAASGARHVVHGLGLMPPERIRSQFAAAIEKLAQRWNVPDGADALFEAIYLHICPPSLQPAEKSPWRRVLPLRPAAGMPLAGERLPYAPETLPYQRTVHLTLGTVFNEAAAGVLSDAIAGLRRLPVNVIVTVGPNVDPARFAPQPAHVRIERYVPHALLLPCCDLVVSQGGAGIMFGALGHGLPQLVIPQGADQFMNADACCASGAALALTNAEVHADTIAAAAHRLLAEGGFTLAARSIQAQIEAMPDAAWVFATLAEEASRTNGDRRSSSRCRVFCTQTNNAPE